MWVAAVHARVAGQLSGVTLVGEVGFLGEDDTRDAKRGCARVGNPTCDSGWEGGMGP